ncbi:hypothetical protein [Photobacterium leiognathi]|uniref:hypothetical protein n=1 Tax=Photobacterium leiognathi TaxID=553611 RepID=UPI002739FF0A|nr:hypothetical protein [Photobacterium leiognathi]
MTIRESQIIKLIIYSTCKHREGVTHLDSINNEKELCEWLVDSSAKKEIINHPESNEDDVFSEDTLKSQLSIVDFKSLIKNARGYYGYNEVIKRTLILFSTHFDLILYPISHDEITGDVDYAAAYISIDMVNRLEKDNFVKRTLFHTKK